MNKLLVGLLIGAVVISLLVCNMELSFWWLFLLFPIYAVMFFFSILVLSGRRDYREMNGKLQIKECGRDWEDFEEHMKRDHPKEWIQLEKDKTEGT